MCKMYVAYILTIMPHKREMSRRRAEDLIFFDFFFGGGGGGECVWEEGGGGGGVGEGGSPYTTNTRCRH